MLAFNPANLGFQLPIASALCSGALALAAMVRARRSLVRWVFVAGMLVLMADSLCSWRLRGVQSPEEIIRWQQWRLVALSPLIGLWLLFSLSYARGNARDFLVKWRLPLAGALLLPAGLVFFWRDELMVRQDDSPGTGWSIHLGPAGLIFHLLLVLGSILVLMNLERTFRASVGTMRWRIKFMLLGVGTLFVARLYTASETLLFQRIDPALENLNAGALLVATVLMLRSFSRAGHFEVEVYPSQSVLQGSITIFLAGTYLVVVAALAKAVVFLGGESAFGLKAFVVLVALVSLAILLQSDRVRLFLRRFVSRHFQRPLYDYRTAWKIFIEGTASCLEQKELARSLVRLVAEMFQTLSVSLWLVSERRETLTLAASTSVSEVGNRDPEPQADATRAVLGRFQRQPEPVEIEDSIESWADILRRWHPREFPNGGNRVAVPMVLRGEILGVIILGDRVGGIPFSTQDFDLLKCVGDHAAASLLNVQLAQKLSQAREIEAFQTMAAFFVHDLKNAGSTLSLMLQNLPVHFDDPVFREDVLRGMAKTVAHINRLTSRLSLVRHELTIKAVEADLNEVVTQALAGLDTGAGSTLVKELAPLPAVRLDPEQMQKVVTNLVLNGLEAVSAQGQVRVLTARTDSSVLLTVADNGCGMSAEFLQHSLFRPFQTTKQGGLGIGMFQSRKIVEAHGGKITVASEPGQGTTFQVILPRLMETR
jgi:putative PEP-CTERM system histidine kinase